jgi:hypothetical protein
MAQSFAAQALEKIEAVFLDRIDADVQAYEIDGRQVTKIPVNELLELHDKFSAIVRREKAALRVKMGRKSGLTIRVRFQ